MPERVQLRRTKGYRKPEGAIVVARPSLWGNEWTMRDAIHRGVPIERRQQWLVEQYRRELEHWGLLTAYSYVVSEATWERVSADVRATGARNMAEAAPHFLRGHDLACWCPLDQPCHADVLLELANQEGVR